MRNRVNQLAGQQALPLTLLLLACWPVWRWYFRRVVESPEELVNLLAAGAAVLFLCVTPRTPPLRNALLLPALLLLAYAASVALLFPLARAGVAVTALAALVSARHLGTRLHLGIWMLLLLALPIMPSLQFYLGYPLRMAVAWLAAPLLRGSGLAVTPAGACLSWGEQLIAIDAPCSGMNMLWAGLCLGIAMSAMLRLSPWRMTLAVIGATALVILGNTLRSASLFYLEAGIIHGPAWLHTGVGLIVFAATATGIFWFIHRVGGYASCAPPSSS